LDAVPWLVLDTSLLLGGKEPPRGPSWATTPEASAEIQPGGADARRLANWIASGLEVRDASPGSLQTVRQAATKAGNLGRLSEADVSLAALALDLQAILVTDDYTLLDVARRLNVPTQTVNTQGIEGTVDFRPRCTGCGRWFDAMPKREECTVCGSPVKLKPAKSPPPGGAAQHAARTPS
jgi:endoribonuclease Nob1